MAEQAEVVVCVDFGSTFTKTLLVDLEAARVVAVAEHRTTIDTDVLDGFDACLAELARADPRAASAEVLACSSAGGGLRIAVVGNEELVTAEAGRRVALSSGGKVVAVLAAAAGALADSADLGEPDVVLLTGGTDGGNADVIVEAAHALVASGWRGPVVVAGNTDAAADVAAALGDLPHAMADNCVPRIGELRPESARAAIRDVFLTHVIGGKHLSSRADFVAMVHGATPDVVLTGVEVLAREAGDLAVVDVGGATTDVHSVVELGAEDRESSGLARDVVAPTAVTRTVEGDLGMRWSALTTAQAADAAGDPTLLEAGRRRAEDPAYLPTTDADRDDDEAIARAAVGLALRRHAGRSKVVVSPEGRVVERTGRDLREISLLVGSGGAFRHGRAGIAERVLAGSTGDVEGGWQLPIHPQVVVDAVSVLAAVGLVSGSHPSAARRLARTLLPHS